METEWDRQMREQAQANKTLANALKTLLGGVDVKLNPRDFEIHLAKTPHGPKSVTIITDERDKWKVVRDWPQINHVIYQPEEMDERIVIKVSKKRGVEALAKEIKRRLLPGYDAAWDAQVARAGKLQSEADRRLAVLTEFNTLAGNRGEPSPMEIQNGVLRSNYHNLYEIKVSSDGEKVSVYTYLMPVDVARQVIERIKELNPKDA